MRPKMQQCKSSCLKRIPIYYVPPFPSTTVEQLVEYRLKTGESQNTDIPI